MGTDPKRSVVTPDQRAHDHANLFLLGSGVFPTSAASNPTLTIAALALRAVTAIQAARKGYAPLSEAKVFLYFLAITTFDWLQFTAFLLTSSPPRRRRETCAQQKPRR